MSFAIVTIWALLLGAQTRPRDFGHLRFLADSVGIPVEVSWAQAWEESRGDLNPHLRGSRGEWGRFQIRERSAVGLRCRALGLNVRTYSGNTRCHAIVMRELIDSIGVRRAIESWNGSGPAARSYTTRVGATAYFLRTGDI